MLKYLLLGSVVFLISCGSSNAPVIDPPVTAADSIHGYITLSVRANYAQTFASGEHSGVFTDSLSGDFRFDLPPIAFVRNVKTRSGFWKTNFTGNVYELQRYYHSYLCQGAAAFDADTTAHAFSSDVSGVQAGNVQFAVGDNGAYGLTISPLPVGLPTARHHALINGCPKSDSISNVMIEGIPFTNYFTPFIRGHSGSFTGLMSANPKREVDEFVTIDTVSILNSGTAWQVPISVKVSWDIVIE